VTLTFDLLTLKLVCESHQRWGTLIPNLGTLGLWILQLFVMYATDGQTDGRTKPTLTAPFPTGGGSIIIATNAAVHATRCVTRTLFDLLTDTQRDIQADRQTHWKQYQFLLRRLVTNKNSKTTKYPRISTWPHLRCDVGLEERDYRENCLCVTVLCNGAQRYEQFLQVGRSIVSGFDFASFSSLLSK